MNRQYRVEFDCEAAESGTDATPAVVFDRLLDHVAGWVGRRADGVDAATLLASQG
jgi:hypothetical protein